MFTSKGRVVRITSDVFIKDNNSKRVIIFAKSNMLLLEDDIVEVLYATADIEPMRKCAASAYGHDVDETWKFHRVSNPHIKRIK